EQPHRPVGRQQLELDPMGGDEQRHRDDREHDRHRHLGEAGGAGLGVDAPGSAAAARAHSPALARDLALERSFGSRMTLRMRTVVGVTSTHSSSPVNSRDSSRVSRRGGTRFSKESEEAARMFVSFFSLVMFTSMSSLREFSPTTWPSYTSEVGSTKNEPRSWRLIIANGVTAPARSATREPVDRCSIAPCQGS